MTRGASLIRADAIRLPLRDESVDLIVTSPPYFALRSYHDGGEHYDGQIGAEPTPAAFLEALWAVTAECWRVLKPSGSLFVNLGDSYAGSGGHNNATIGGTGRGPAAYTKATDGVRERSLRGIPWRYAIGCTDGHAAPNDERWILRAELVWAKPTAIPEPHTDRVRRTHETWFHLTKKPGAFGETDELRGDLGGAPGSVWTVAFEPLNVPEHVGVDHYAAFPTEWPRRLVLGWSPSGICTRCDEPRAPVIERERVVDFDAVDQYRGPGAVGKNAQTGEKTGAFGRNIGGRVSIVGYACACAEPTAPTRPAVVLDPFGGTGTVAMVARTLGRFGVSLDLSADYLRLARWRVFDSGHAARVERRTWTERQGALL